MMRLNLQLTMGSFSLTLFGLIGVAFGMNLESSFEEVKPMSRKRIITPGVWQIFTTSHDKSFLCLYHRLLTWTLFVYSVACFFYQDPRVFWLVTGFMFLGSGLIWRRLLSFLGRHLEPSVPPLVIQTHKQLQWPLSTFYFSSMLNTIVYCFTMPRYKSGVLLCTSILGHISSLIADTNDWVYWNECLKIKS